MKRGGAVSAAKGDAHRQEKGSKKGAAPEDSARTRERGKR